jgi:hypothetical protein
MEIHPWNQEINKFKNLLKKIAINLFFYLVLEREAWV